MSGSFVLDLDGTRTGLTVDRSAVIPSEELRREPNATIATHPATMARLANGALRVEDAAAPGRLTIQRDRAGALLLLRVLALDPLDS